MVHTPVAPSQPGSVAAGMLNQMRSSPALSSAASMASRKVHSIASHAPLPGSTEELTTKVGWSKTSDDTVSELSAVLSSPATAAAVAVRV